MRAQKNLGTIPRDVTKTPFGDRKNTLQQNPASTPLKSLNSLKNNNTFNKHELATPIKTPLLKLQKSRNHQLNSKPVDYNEEITLKPDGECLVPHQSFLLTDADLDRIMNYNIPPRTPIPPPTLPIELYDFEMPIINDPYELDAFNFNEFNFNGFEERNNLHCDIDDDDDDLPPLPIFELE